MNRHEEAILLGFLLSPIFAILLAIPISAFCIGFMKYNDCPAIPNLPSRLVMFGLFGFVCTLLSIGLFLRSCYEVDDTGMYLYKFICAIGIFLFYIGISCIWAVQILSDLGNMNEKKSLTDVTEDLSHCDPLIVTFSYWITRGIIGMTIVIVGFLMRLFNC